MEKSFKGEKQVGLSFEAKLYEYQLDRLISLLGKEGILDVQVDYLDEPEPAPAEAAIKNGFEQEPTLGYTTFKELHSFFASQADMDLKDRTDAGLWNTFVYRSHASELESWQKNDFGEQQRGKIEFGSEQLEAFQIGAQAESDARASTKNDRLAPGYKLNLDTVAVVLADNEDSHWLSPQAEELAKRLIESRWAELEQA